MFNKPQFSQWVNFTEGAPTSQTTEAELSNFRLQREPSEVFGGEEKPQRRTRRHSVDGRSAVRRPGHRKRRSSAAMVSTASMDTKSVAGVSTFSRTSQRSGNYDGPPGIIRTNSQGKNIPMIPEGGPAQHLQPASSVPPHLSPSRQGSSYQAQGKETWLNPEFVLDDTTKLLNSQGPLMFWFDMLTTIVAAYYLFETPLVYVYLLDIRFSSGTALGVVNLSALIIMWIGIISRFFITVDVHKERMIIVDQGQIAALYAKGWLIPDLVIAFPFAALPLTPVVLLLRMVRCALVLKVVAIWRTRITRTSSRTRVMPFVLGFWCSVIMHWSTCFWILFDPTRFTTTVHHGYIRGLYWAVTTLTTIGYTIFVMLIGVGIYGYVLGNFISSFSQQNLSARLYDQRMQMLDGYLKYHRVPPHLQDEVYEYYSYQWDQRQGLDRETILSGLPASLASKIAQNLNKDIMQKVKIFKHANPLIMHSLGAALKPRVYIPHQYIYRDGDHADSMFFVGKGIVDIVDIHGLVLRTVEEGDFFGETDLLQEQARHESARSVDYSVVYILNRAAFRQLLFYHPEFAMNILNIAETNQYKATKSLKIFANCSNDLIKLVATELRHKTYSTGQYIFRCNELPEAMYIIDRGRVLLVDEQNESKGIELGSGDVLGEMSLLRGSKHYLGAVCISTVAVYQLEKEAFSRLYNLLPEFAETINNLAAERRRTNVSLNSHMTHLVRYFMKGKKNSSPGMRTPAQSAATMRSDAMDSASSSAAPGPGIAPSGNRGPPRKGSSLVPRASFRRSHGNSASNRTAPRLSAEQEDLLHRTLNGTSVQSDDEESQASSLGSLLTMTPTSAAARQRRASEALSAGPPPTFSPTETNGPPLTQPPVPAPVTSMLDDDLVPQDELTLPGSAITQSPNRSHVSIVTQHPSKPPDFDNDDNDDDNVDEDDNDGGNLDAV